MPKTFSSLTVFVLVSQTLTLITGRAQHTVSTEEDYKGGEDGAQLPHHLQVNKYSPPIKETFFKHLHFFYIIYINILLTL